MQDNEILKDALPKTTIKLGLMNGLILLFQVSEQQSSYSRDAKH
jgi:hypothetical protein